MYVLDCINRNKPIRNFRPRIDKIIPEYFKDIFYEYDNFLSKNYSYSTILSSESILARFLTFLNNSGIITLNDIIFNKGRELFCKIIFMLCCPV